MSMVSRVPCPDIGRPGFKSDLRRGKDGVNVRDAFFRCRQQRDRVKLFLIHDVQFEVFRLAELVGKDARNGGRGFGIASVATHLDEIFLYQNGAIAEPAKGIERGQDPDRPAVGQVGVRTGTKMGIRCTKPGAGEAFDGRARLIFWHPSAKLNQAFRAFRGRKLGRATA